MRECNVGNGKNALLTENLIEHTLEAFEKHIALRPLLFIVQDFEIICIDLIIEQNFPKTALATSPPLFKTVMQQS